MKTYDHDIFDDYPPYDKVFDDIRSGALELGDRVLVWDYEWNCFVVGVAERCGGQPSVRILGRAKITYPRRYNEGRLRGSSIRT